MEKDAPIFVAGHQGMVGSAILRVLEKRGFCNIRTKSRSELDLRNGQEVEKYFSAAKPAYVFSASAKVGGILANQSFPAEFIYDNLAIQTNLIHQAFLHKVKKFLFLGSSCIYPRDCEQPIREEYLLSGPLELTNQWYAIAKIAGIKMCQAYRRQYGCDYIAVMPTNLYGPFDNFNFDTAHVIPALIAKIQKAKENGVEAVIWGTGAARREFLYVNDCAEACVFLMEQYSDEKIINLGVGKDISIKELVALIAEVLGYSGTIHWDKTKPDGTPRKLLDCRIINSLGWYPKVKLRDGIQETYSWYLENIARVVASH